MTNIGGRVTISEVESVEGIYIPDYGWRGIHLENNAALNIVKGWIDLGGKSVSIDGAGFINSERGLLKIYNSNPRIGATLTMGPYSRIGSDVEINSEGGEVRLIVMTPNSQVYYPGYFRVSGRGATLSISNSGAYDFITNGITISNGAILDMTAKLQITDTLSLFDSKLTDRLESSSSSFFLMAKRLVIGGRSVIDFNKERGTRMDFESIQVASDGLLEIYMNEIYSSIVVSGDVDSLLSSINRVSINGKRAAIEAMNNNNYKIISTDDPFDLPCGWNNSCPEPATYGAIFGVLGLSVVVYQKHRGRSNRVGFGVSRGRGHLKPVRNSLLGKQKEKSQAHWL